MWTEKRSIPGFEGLYEITNDGTVISNQLDKQKILSHCVCSKGKGTHTVLLSKAGVVNRCAVGALVLIAFKSAPKYDETKRVKYKDNDRSNLSPDNLYWQKKSKRKIGEHKPRVRSVEMLDDDKNVLAMFTSIKLAESMSGAKKISQALRLGIKSGDYYWRYK